MDFEAATFEAPTDWDCKHENWHPVGHFPIGMGSEDTMWILCDDCGRYGQIHFRPSFDTKGNPTAKNKFLTLKKSGRFPGGLKLFDAEDDEVESIRIQLLEIEDMDEDDLTVEDMDNYNNLETRLWELTGGFEAEDFEATNLRSRKETEKRFGKDLAKYVHTLSIGAKVEPSHFCECGNELTIYPRWDVAESHKLGKESLMAECKKCGWTGVVQRAAGTFDAEYHYEPYWDYGAFAHTPCQAVIVFDIDDAGTSKENTGKCEECGETITIDRDEWDITQAEFNAEEMMIPRWTPEGVIMTPVSDAYGAFYGADGRPIMLISKVSRESMTDEDWEEAKKEIEESQNSTFKIGIPDFGSELESDEKSLFALGYFRAEFNAEEILLCKKEDCDNERDMSVSWMGMCEPCYEVHQESCKGCRDFERSKRENPNPPTNNWKKYNSECTDKDAESFSADENKGYCVYCGEGSQIGIGGDYLPSCGKYVCTDIGDCYTDHLERCGVCAEIENKNWNNPNFFIWDYKKDAECFSAESPSATNEQIRKEIEEAREKDFQRNWETLDKNPETNPYGRGPVSSNTHTMKVIKKYGEKAVQDALKPPSATIPSWAKPLATVIGFGLGFLGIRELKKRV